MADQREAVDMAARIVADETGKETASAWQVAHVDGSSMSTKYGEGCDALVFLHHEDAVDKAFSEEESYANADDAPVGSLVTIEPIGPWVTLARAVIALDEEVRRLRGLLGETRQQWPYPPPTSQSKELRDRIDSELSAQPAPSSPGASEARGEDGHERNGPPHNECIATCEACRQLRIVDNASTQVAAKPAALTCPRCGAEMRGSRCGCGVRLRHG